MSHEDIPFFAQIIALADTLDLNFDLGNACNTDSVSCKSDRLAVINFVNDHRNTYFSPLLSDVFVTIAGEPDFWEALSPGKLTEEEFEEIKIHPTVTRNCLKDIMGFEEITNKRLIGLLISNAFSINLNREVLIKGNI